MIWHGAKQALLILLLSPALFAVEIATPFRVQRSEIHALRELKVYKDPSLFLPNLSDIHMDPLTGWESLMEESPLLTTVKGNVCLVRLAPPTPFKNFGVISRLYELAEPRLKPIPTKSKTQKAPLIVPVQLCGENPYSDSLGFVLLADLNSVQRRPPARVPHIASNPEQKEEE